MNIKHGMHLTREYRSWNAMKTRCSNPRCPEYPNYGGRGITVCTRWHRFEAFFADMGAAAAGLSLDRIDTNGNYEPSNCRWATAKQQQQNKRDNVLLVVNGETMCVKEAARRFGMWGSTIKRRLQKGWCGDQAVMIPPIPVHQRQRVTPDRVADMLRVA